MRVISAGSPESQGAADDYQGPEEGPEDDEDGAQNH